MVAALVHNHPLRTLNVLPSSQPPPHQFPLISNSLAAHQKSSKMDHKQTLGFLAVLLCFGMIAAADNSLATKCAAEFQKVTPCLPFATAKASDPTKDCCDSVTALKNSDPACICYIIQQIHNGSNDAAKSMGVQEARLLQLPSACKLANASISECPKLLHLPANSPDAAIFNNATAAATTTGPPTKGGGGGNGGGSSAAATGSDGIWHKPQLFGCVIFAATAFFLGFPSGVPSVVPAV